MSTQIIGIKQLHQDLKNISKETAFGNSFIVVKNSKPVFKIMPLNDVEENNKFSIDDLESIQFNSDDKEMSKKIDEYIY